MSSLYRRDDWCTDALGNALAGVSLWVCTQPADTESSPPSPLAQIFSDPAGADPITQPILSDGLGHTFFYVAQGTYTLVFDSAQVQENILTDQVIVSPYNGDSFTYNNDSSTAGSITGAIDGSNTVFTLSASPAPPNSLLFAVNGLVQTGWTLSGSTVTLAVAPRSGYILNAIYQHAS